MSVLEGRITTIEPVPLNHEYLVKRRFFGWVGRVEETRIPILESGNLDCVSRPANGFASIRHFLRYSSSAAEIAGLVPLAVEGFAAASIPSHLSRAAKS
jgi:hypothetical protein